MEEQVYAVADIGGTKILLMLVSPDRDVILRRILPTPSEAAPELVAGVLQEALFHALQDEGRDYRSLAGLGVCIAALVDFEEGVIHESPNLDWHEPVYFRKMLQDYCRCPVLLENDANAAVLGEVKYGAARGHRHAAYITISTGIGAGLYLNGDIYRGSGGFAGEIGHVKRFGKGRRCGCGGYGCLEAWASGLGIARSAISLWGESDPLKGPLNSAAVFSLAAAGNTLAASIIENAVDDIGTALANLVTLLNPSCLVIGGGVARNQPALIGMLQNKIEEIAVPPAVKITRVKVEAARLEPDAGAWGMFAMMCR